MSDFVTYDWEAGKPKRTAANVTLPPKTFEKDGLRIVDLTKVIDPSTESRRCNLWRFNTGGAVPDFHTNVDIGSHLGTHCQCPYHHDSNWPSVAELPVSQFMGRGIYVKLDLPADHIITAEDLDKALGKKIRPHDTVILDSLDESLRIPPFTSLTGSDRDHRLQVGADMAQYLADKDVQCVGFGDGVAIEGKVENVKPFHDILMAKNVTFLEVLQNLDQLHTDTFFISYAPVPIIGLDSCPVRVYAIEGMPGFTA